MNLLQLQRRMAQDVRRPLTGDFRTQSETWDGASTRELAESYIKANDRLTSFERLEIYNRQYWFRVTASLAEDYPALSALLGVKRFDHMVLAYLQQNPSTSFTLRNLGAELPRWLGSHPESASRRHKLSLAVARLEWAYIEAFDSAAEPPLGPSDLAGLGPDSRLSLQPHLQLLDLDYPVDELVLAVHKNKPAMDVTSNAVSARKRTCKPSLPAMRRERVYLAVHRFANSVYYRRVDREAFSLLAALQQGTPLGHALEAAFAGSVLNAEEQATRIQEYFAHASELGWFCREHSSPA